MGKVNSPPIPLSSAEERIKVSQKRIKLHLPMEQLYPDPERYDLRIVLLSKDDRRLDREMGKGHVEGKALPGSGVFP